RKKENLADAFSGAAEKPMRIRLQHGDHKVNAEFKKKADDQYILEVGPNNDPDVLKAFRKLGPPTVGSILNVDFIGDRFSELGAKISWLRSGYLVLVAAFGYKVAFDPALQIVKRQIANPESRIIYSFTIDMARPIPWSDRRILTIPDPRCVGVQFGRYVLLYP